MSNYCYQATPEDCLSMTQTPINSDFGSFTLDDELIGTVVEVYPTTAFNYAETSSRYGQQGKLKIILLENSQQNEPEFPWKHYKMLIWGDDINRFNFMPGSTYKITKFKQVLRKRRSSTNKSLYPFDIHAMKNTTFTLC